MASSFQPLGLCTGSSLCLWYSVTFFCGWRRLLLLSAKVTSSEKPVLTTRFQTACPYSPPCHRLIAFIAIIVSAKVLSIHLFIVNLCPHYTAPGGQGPCLFTAVYFYCLHGSWHRAGLTILCGVSKWMRGLQLVSSGRIHSVTTFPEGLDTFGPFYTLCLCAPTHSLSYSGFIWKPKCCLMTRKHEI